MYEAALQGLLAVVRWPAIGYLVLGVLLGTFFGAVPGLSGLVGMAILLPFTFNLDTYSAFAFLLGMYAITTTADTISSVLLGVPGTAASQATILDGYPLAMKGEAARAFGAAYTVSAIGGVLGAMMLVASIPIVRPFVMSFGSPEFFMLGVLGLTMVGALSGNSVLNGIAAGLLGLLVSMVGYSPQGGTPRYDFGATYLLDGVPIIPPVLGLFAIPELLALATRTGSISKVAADRVEGGMALGIRDAFRHWWLVIRCSAIGVYIGMLPGLGASIVDWAAYGHAVQSAKDKSQFGKGDIRGVIAPESANNAMKGGGLIPTIAFGIPGTASMAILLGAFLIQGLTPGPDMLTRNLNVTFAMVWTLIIANVLAAVVLMFWTNQIAKVTFVRSQLMVPPIVLFVFMGAWMATNDMGDWYTLLVFGLLGLLMNHAGWPRPPLVLGFILGTIMERSLDLSLQAFGMEWIFRPVSVVLAVIALLTILASLRGARRARKEPATISNKEETETRPQGSSPAQDGENGNPAVSFVLSLIVLVAFIYSVVGVWGYRKEVSSFPTTVGIAGALLTLVIFQRDLRAVGHFLSSIQRKRRLNLLQIFTSGFKPLGKVGVVFFWLVGLLPLTWLVGQEIAIPIFMLLYLKLWGKEKWPITLSLSFGGWLFLRLVFEEVIHVNWYSSIFFS
jgi:putative tricarboxylic transport membrane protein